MLKKLQMDFNLDQLRSFIVVARTGTLSAAAKELGTTQPNLGRQMTALEKEVNLVLFVRHSRGLGLTKQGQEFLDLCQDIVGRLAQKTSIIREKNYDPEGSFHFVSGFGLLETILENIASFSLQYPQLSFAFSPITNVYQLEIGEADAAVMPMSKSIPNTDLIQRHLYDTTMRIFASPNYLKSRQTPRTLDDLQYHRLVVFSGEKQEILNKQIIHQSTVSFLRPFIEVVTAPAMRIALINGAGIGCYAYNEKIVKQGLLVDVFPDLPDHIISYYYVYHKRLEGSPKIEAFYKFLKEINKIWDWREKKNVSA